MGLEVQRKREKLDIRQGLLVEMYVNARKIEETIEEYYDRRKQNKKRKRDRTQEMQKAEVMISWSKRENSYRRGDIDTQILEK